MKRGALMKIFFCGLFCVSLFLNSTHFLISQETQGGNLFGFIYDKDKNTPLEGAVVVVKNISTSEVFLSTRSNRYGIYTIRGLKPGLYIFGVDTREGNFESNSIIGVRANETATLSMALMPYSEETVSLSREAALLDRAAPGISTTGGETALGTEQGQSQPERPAAKKETALGLPFLDPAGVASIVAASSTAAIGVVDVGEEEFIVSPFK